MTPYQDIELRIAKLEAVVATLEGKMNIPSTEGIQSKGVKKISVKEFLIKKNIDNDVKRTLAIAYYLEKIDGVEAFNVDDLKRGYHAAKYPIPSNINDKVNLGIKGGHLMEMNQKKDSKKAWTLTASGEAFVEYDFVAKK